MTQQITLSQRLHEQLGQVIATTKPGDRLLTEPLLARQLGVSRATLREAMRTYETQGLIRRRQGVGTFVLRPAHVLESGLEILESLETVAQRMGLHAVPGEIVINHRPVYQDESLVLGIAEAAQVVSVSRVILADDRPAAYLIDVLPSEFITLDELGDGFNGSVLDLLMRRGDPLLANSHCDIAAVAASPDVARALNIQRGDALLRFKSRLFTIDGRVIDYSLGYFLPGYFRFHVIRELS
jgi:GntR family transcriptional regulator